MSAVARAAVLLLALAPGVAAWALRTSIDFEWLVFLGTLGLLGGILALGQPLPRRVGPGVTVCAGLTLLATTGFEMRAMAGGFRPFSLYAGLTQKDLLEWMLPVASEGESLYDPPHYGRVHVILTIDATGSVAWKGGQKCLDEIDEVLHRHAGR